MTGFNRRTEASAKLIELLSQYFWVNVDLIHYEYGYETHIEKRVQSSLRLRESTTAKHIRFAPDFIVYDENVPNIDFLFEYKVTKTPRYTLREQQWYQGQIEADAFDNYINLVKAGISVAIVIYCPYSERPLLCDVPQLSWLSSKRQRTSNSLGSGTDFYNINLTKLRTFEQFIEQELKISRTIIDLLLNKEFYAALRSSEVLKTTHNYRSQYNSNHYSTGFNWLPKYK